MLLTALDTAQTIDDMDIPGLRLDPLKGTEQARWSVWVNGNWRLPFEFRNGHAKFWTMRIITDGHACPSPW
jgi:toxin HigB-1